jgi:PRC-barrel domain protein
MRTHSRWTVAAVTALLALALASPASARAHRRTHADAHPAPAAAPAPPPAAPQAPTSGTHPSGAEPVSQPSVAAIGKGLMSAAAIDPHDVETILGKSVRSSAGEDMGRLVDVIVDRDGRPRAAIIDFGGFLGVGSRKIAVDWGVLRFAHDKDKGDVITVELTRDQVKAAPEFKEGSSLVVLGPGTAPNPAPGAPTNPEPKPQAQEK